MTDTAAADLAADLQAWEDDHQASRSPSVGPSDVATCRRQLQYRLTGTPADDDHDDDPSMAVAGSLLHLAVAHVRKLAHPEALVEASVTVPGLERPGTVDYYVDGVVDDLKTHGCRAFDKATERGELRDDHHDQALVYALGLEDAGHPVHTVQVTYYDRCRGGILRLSVPYDRERALRAVMRLHAVLDAVEEGRELPRDERHPRTTACERCPFTRRCWELDVPPAEGPGPLTTHAELLAERELADPLPDDLAELARERLQLAAQLEELEERKREADQRLRGWQGATFTDAGGKLRRVAWTNPAAPGTVDDGKAAAELLRQLGHAVPQTTGRATSAALYLRPVTVKAPRKRAPKLEG